MAQLIIYTLYFNILSTDLYRLDQEMANTITKYIFGNSSKTTRDQIKEKLSNILGEWKVFNEDEEIELDEIIKKNLGNSWEIFLKKCNEADVNKTEVITYYEFKQICKGLHFDYNSDVEQYLKILFYTDKFQLNVVPYLSFIIAYAPGKQ